MLRMVLCDVGAMCGMVLMGGVRRYGVTAKVTCVIAHYYYFFYNVFFVYLCEW